MRWRLSKLDWRYAIGELIIVTAGVLIALAIGQWNNDRQDRAEEQSILLGLKSEFEQNLGLIETELNYRNAVVSSILQIFDASDESTSLDSGAFDQLLGDVTWWETTEYSRGAIDSITQSGNLSIIVNEELRRLLASMPSLYATSERIESQDEDNARNVIIPFLTENSSLTQIANTMAGGRPGTGDSPTPPIYPINERNDHTALLDDPEFLGILVREHWDHRTAIANYGALQMAIERLMLLIDEELED